MESFLQHVIKTILTNEYKLAISIFVLPNQRAGIYVKKHLKESLSSPAFFPEIITFDKFAEQLAGIPKIPAIELLFDFYSIYKKVTPDESIESFDSFSQWASIVLNDINEIDMHLIDAKAIFSKLKDINSIENWSPDSSLISNHKSFLQKIEIYYKELQKLVISKQKAYQGFLFKEAVKSVQLFIENTDKHLFFIGFNYLTTSEAQIIQELLIAKRGTIFFNISKQLLKTKAGFFIDKYLNTWPFFKKNKVTLYESRFDSKKIEIIGIPENIGMLKYAGELLENNTEESETTALVLAEQTLLPIALNSIPQIISKINITMGVPLSVVPFSDLVKAVFELHQSLENTDKTNYYHKHLFKVLAHPIIQSQIPSATKLLSYLLKQNKISIGYDEIVRYQRTTNTFEKEIIEIIFSPITENTILQFLERIQKLINTLKNNVTAYEKEILYRQYQLIRQVKKLLVDYPYIDSIRSLFKLYKRLLFTEKINFIGEPLQGLQIMGFLETQAIDFNHLIITSVNEGVLPKGKRSNSFIPFDVRKQFELPTYQEEDRISSYHFFRLLERANKVKLLYNSQTDSFGGGEKSRFLTQLLWENPEIKHTIIHSKVPSETNSLLQINKSPDIIKHLKKIVQKGISPSAFGLYLYNPMAFYYQKILGIQELSSVEESIENNTLGTILHDALEEIYKPFVGRVVQADSLEKTLPKLPQVVTRSFQKNYKNGQFEHGKNKLIFEVITNYVRRFVLREIQEIKGGNQIKILALEKELEHMVFFEKLNTSVCFKGYVDRIDEVNGNLRIVDYKSGKVTAAEMRIDDFSKIHLDYKYAKGLQVLLYAYLYTQTQDFNFSQNFQAGVISFKNLNKGFIPVNFSSGRTKDISITPDRLQEFINSIQELLLDVFDPSIPFKEKE